MVDQIGEIGEFGDVVAFGEVADVDHVGQLGSDCQAVEVGEVRIFGGMTGLGWVTRLKTWRD